MKPARLMSLASRLYDLPPRQVVHQIRRRLAGGSAQVGTDYSGLLPTRPTDFLFRLEGILARSIGWEPVDFSGAHVLEVGAGPQVFWGPLAVFLGAEAYVSVDPDSRTDIFADEGLVTAYLRPMHGELTALFGPRMSFDDFVAGIRERVRVIPETLLEAGEIGPFDLVLSNSCLEHVFPLEESLVRIAELTRPGGRFLHLVNFGSHLPGDTPFSGLYTQEPEQYWTRNRKTINLTRLGGMRDAFVKAGLETRVIPVSGLDEARRYTPTAEWCRDLPEEDLWTRTALFVGTRP